jgi:phosphatidylserine/phosphatidylglycerophosphate/cardiolipin synthase-like enzyme
MASRPAASSSTISAPSAVQKQRFVRRHLSRHKTLATAAVLVAVLAVLLANQQRRSPCMRLDGPGHCGSMTLVSGACSSSVFNIVRTIDDYIVQPMTIFEYRCYGHNNDNSSMWRRISCRLGSVTCHILSLLSRTISVLLRGLCWFVSELWAFILSAIIRCPQVPLDGLSIDPHVRPDPQAIGGNDYVQNLIDGVEIFDALISDFQSAQHSIHVQMFLLWNDLSGQRVATELLRKARAGVHVRIMIDLSASMADAAYQYLTCYRAIYDDQNEVAHGGRNLTAEIDPAFHALCKHPALLEGGLFDVLREAGVRIQRSDIDYHRIVDTTDQQYRANAEAARASCHNSLNCKDHRKIISIDGGRIAYMGSANLCSQYIYTIPYNESEFDNCHWHDGFVRITVPAGVALEELFRERWVLVGGDEYSRYQPPAISEKEHRQVLAMNPAITDPVDSIQFVAASPGFMNRILSTFLQLIASAKREIFILNPYFIHPDIVHGLTAAKRQRPSLHITLVVPQRDVNEMTWDQDAMERYYEEWLDAGITIVEYCNHMPHLKVALFDDAITVVGSANLNFRSLDCDRDFELIAIITSRTFASSVREQVQVPTDPARCDRSSPMGGTPSCHMVRVEELTWRHRYRNPVTFLLESLRLL